MSRRAYHDPTLDAVIHLDACRNTMCPRCTKPPARVRLSPNDQVRRSGNNNIGDAFITAAASLQKREDPERQGSGSISTQHEEVQK